MEALIQQILSGLASGGIYASVGLALVMIYQSTHHINFAQGEMAMFSTFIAWALLQAGWPYWGAFGATVLVSFVGGLAIQRIILSEGTAMDIAEQARREGVRDLRQSGLVKVRGGVTTLEEVLAATNE